MTARTVLVMAGGTGGHIFPALAVAEALRTRGWHPVWLGACGKMEANLVPKYGIHLELLPVSGVRGKGFARFLKLPFEQFKALRLALAVLRQHQPAAVIGFGGFTGFPGGVAAWLTGRPLLIHEQNSVAGLTNRLLALLARRVLTAFPGVFAHRAELVGNPIREEIRQVAAPAARFAGRSGPLRLLVVGGSLGAAALNEAVPRALARLPADTRPQVRHQAGASQIEALRRHYQEAGVEGDCVAFIDDMASAYAEADLVICRAGALTISELAAVGVASVLVPLPHAVDDHQTGNARYLAKAGAAVLLPQAEATPERLAALLAELDRARLLSMAEAARGLARPNATEAVVRAIEELFAKPRQSV
ncbi:undecaprenyldiphospho-muramoylpentapeptide beta-N-acetylglucosaminyltransferase [Chitinimonas lacunae]|uniref:UDP-N-acetylglucosamine--N-acetylmuramyl-(pentapeptide) pyrophosphoryl-undecaprenol N-acetylglucosamine transferase n=1 Tax=Chitinimonas lacunae TaxID=1963018 RepID=A0ABV8MSV4_9NEIS